MFIKSFMRISKISLKTWHHRKKVPRYFGLSTATTQGGLKYLQTYVEICAHTSGWTLISTWQVILYQLCLEFKILFSLGLIRFRRTLRKLLSYRQLRLSGSSLFHFHDIKYARIWFSLKTRILAYFMQCLWHSKKRVLEILGLSHGLIKAMDIFKDFVINNFVK